MMKGITPSTVSSTIALDRGLRLIQLARDEGSIRVMDAAVELGVSRPTAHRLLQALVFRHFLVQDDMRRYVPGPFMAAQPVSGFNGGRIRRLAEPHMRWLTEQTQQSCNLMMRVDREVRFLRCITANEGTPDRLGFVTSAHNTSGGRSMLAALNREELIKLYTSEDSSLRLPSGELKGLLGSLEKARRDGFATASRNRDGLFAVGTVINPSSMPKGGFALAISVPTSKPITGPAFYKLIEYLAQARRLIEQAEKQDAANSPSAD
jgi:DNA-binding IclR family transcriptional regulator